ncbi:alpha/beta hydrolase [Sphingobacterium multivorum]|uniref:alpha/beta hydrolase n=1 Tax=Sphingobacterium multivorum TaxID=28454 RepID=UPI00345EA3D2
MKILFKLIVVISLFAVVSCSPIKGLYNNFSAFKHQGELQPEANKPIRVFLDRWGDVYPDMIIEEGLFRDSLSVLESYFHYQDHLAQLYKKYDLSFTEPISHQDFRDKFTYLQDHLHKYIADSIDRMAEFKKLVFFIHGYNNTPEAASEAFSEMEKKIVERYPDQKFLMVELYWDGLQNKNKHQNSIKIWGNAQVSAAYAGMGLRNILNKLHTDSMYVITHSHGAAVITEALFNVRRFHLSYYDTERDGKELVGLQESFDTPQTNFVVGMIAPAIPGMNVFYRYDQRTGSDGAFTSKQKNYKFINGFNKNDKVVNKYIRAPKRLGSTTLACDSLENIAVQKHFSSTPGLYVKVDFAPLGYKQTSHQYLDYIKNPASTELLDKMFK